MFWQSVNRIFAFNLQVNLIVDAAKIGASYFEIDSYRQQVM
jgi:hypothetical protein